jgi:hypothetical protein
MPLSPVTKAGESFLIINFPHMFYCFKTNLTPA